MKNGYFIGNIPYFQKLFKGLSENVGYIPNEIAIFHRDNDHYITIGYV